VSHIQNLNELKQLCQTTSQCNEYQTLLQYENQQIDSYTASHIQSSIMWGLIIGVTAILTPFVKPIHMLQKYILPKLVITIPIVISIAGGAFTGFAIKLSACYKQSCSPFENYAMIWVPLATLILTIPLSIKIYRKRQTIIDNINKPNPMAWIITGTLIVTAAAIFTVSSISEHRKNGEAQKQYLLNSEL
jgi:hypothetical protein